MSELKLFALLAAAALLLASCAGTDTNQSDTSSGTSSNAGSQGGTSNAPDNSTSAPADVSDMFTKRDLDQSYDESKCIKVDLSSGSITPAANGVTVSGGNVTIKKEGVYIITGSAADGQIIVDADKAEKIQLVLNGLTLTSATSAAIYVRSADKVFITTAAGSENRLENGGKYVAIDDNNIDACIFSKSDLTLGGSGSLTVVAAEGHGVVSKDDLCITGGQYVINAKKHALSGKDSVRIAGGSFQLTSGKDGIHAENKDDATKGFAYISGGDIKISADDDGIHAASTLTICGGNIDISKSDEGLEGLSVNISGGNIRIVSKDDGINAAGGNKSTDRFGPFGGAATEGAEIVISGGVININAGGDGVDSNGKLAVSGGSLFISGPTSNGDSAIDFETEAVITGGTVVAAGSMGMAENFGTSSTQCSMLVNLGGSAGSAVTLYDSDGGEILSYTPEKAYQCVVISCGEISVGKTYTVRTGNGQTQVQMTSTIYGGGFGGPGGRPGGPGGGQPPRK